MIVRFYRGCDYPAVASAYRGRGMEPLPECMISPGSSFVATDDGGNFLALLVCYIERTQPVAMLAWLVASPAVLPRIRHSAVTRVCEAAVYCLKKQNVKFALSRLSNKSAERLLGRLGFVPTCEVKNEMGIRL